MSQDLKHTYGQALEQWDDMDAEEKRRIFHLFIAKIEATMDEERILALVIYWQDGSTDNMEIRRVGATGKLWMPQDNERLVRLGVEGASQVEIAKAFPKRTWQSISNKHFRLAGRRLTWGKRSNAIRQTETYKDYLERTQSTETLNMGSDPSS